MVATGLVKRLVTAIKKQRQSDQAETNGNLNAANMKIKRHLEFALARLRVTEHEHGQAVHREAPDDAEGVKVRKKSNVATADEDGQNLQRNDDVDDAIAGAESRMRLPEPRAENAVLGDAIEHAIRADDGGIDRSSQDECAHHHNENVKDQAGNQRPVQTHRQPADQVFEVTLPNAVGDDHHGEERNQRSEDQAINEND